MNKYLAIIDMKTAMVLLQCILLTYLCIEYDFSYNLNITLLSIAVVFPLVFTMREAFKRRERALRYLSLFKSSLFAVYYCIDSCDNLAQEKKGFALTSLEGISKNHFDFLRDIDTDLDKAHSNVNELFIFIKENSDSIPARVSLRIIRFMEDVHESIEATISIKGHGTPISVRAYCLVFIFLFPLVFVPVIVFNMADITQWIVYGLSMIHGFILISLYNVQEAIEDPFDQIGLDDIRLDEFHFNKAEVANSTPANVEFVKDENLQGNS